MMKTENEKLREVLRCIADLPMDRCSTENDYRLSAAKAIALGALSQQAEPTCSDERPCVSCFSGDGACLAEPAPAQDEREAVVTVACIDLSTDAGVVLYANRDHWLDNELLMTVAQHERIVSRLARPAQAEQQPVGHQFQDREGVWKQFMSERHYEDTLADGTWPIRAIYAAPFAQTAPQPEEVKAAIRNLRCIGKTVLSSEARASMRADLESAAQLLIKLSSPQPQPSGLVEAELAIRKFESANWHGSKGYHAGLLKAADIVAALSAQGESHE